MIKNDQSQIEQLMRQLKNVSIFRGFIEGVLYYGIDKDSEDNANIFEQKRKALGVPDADALAVYIDMGLNKIAESARKRMEK